MNNLWSYSVRHHSACWTEGDLSESSPSLGLEGLNTGRPSQSLSQDLRAIETETQSVCPQATSESTPPPLTRGGEVFWVGGWILGLAVPHPVFRQTIRLCTSLSVTLLVVVPLGIYSTSGRTVRAITYSTQAGPRLVDTNELRVPVTKPSTYHTQYRQKRSKIH